MIAEPISGAPMFLAPALGIYMHIRKCIPAESLNS